MITPTIPVKLSCPKCGSKKLVVCPEYPSQKVFYQHCYKSWHNPIMRCGWRSETYPEGQVPWYWWIDETDNVYNPQ